MGMIANYQQITAKELEELKSQEDLVEAVEDLQDNVNLDLCDIDKMWDALHFLLTGKSASDPIENDFLSEAIVGQFNISEDDDEEFVAGIEAYRVKEIADALQNIDFEQYIEKFNMGHFAKNDIYPNIWGYEDETDEIIDDLRTSFKSLQEFYVRMAEKEYAVLASIY